MAIFFVSMTVSALLYIFYLSPLWLSRDKPEEVFLQFDPPKSEKFFNLFEEPEPFPEPNPCINESQIEER
jgi:hypothetical protein